MKGTAERVPADSLTTLQRERRDRSEGREREGKKITEDQRGEGREGAECKGREARPRKGSKRDEEGRERKDGTGGQVVNEMFIECRWQASVRVPSFLYGTPQVSCF